MKKKLKVMAAALLASALPLSGCTVLGFEIPGTESIPNIKIPGADLMKDLLNKVDILDIIPDGDDNGDDNQGDNNNNDDNTTTKTVTNVTVTGGKNLIAGQTVTLTAKVSGDNLSESDKTVSWSSSSTAVAEVSSSGVVTAKSAGTVVITATSTLDSTKKGTATIVVSPAAWSDADKEMMESTVGYVLPYFTLPINTKWTDEYFDEYGCLSAEVSGDHVSEIVSAMKAVSGFVYEGTEVNENLTLHIFNYDLGEKVGNLNFQVYCASNVTSIDVYFEYPVYSTWPTAVIAESLSSLNINVATPLPALTDPTYQYQIIVDSVELGEEEVPCVVIYVGDTAATESEYIMPAEYAQVLEDTGLYNISDEDGMYWCNAKDKTHTIVAYEDSYYYAIYILVLPYQAEKWIDVEKEAEMLAVSDTFQINYEKGDDVTEDVVFSSSNAEVATVDPASGLVTAVAPGTATITLTAGTVTAQVTIEVVAEIPTAFTEEQITVFKENIHDADGVVVPFNKLFRSVAYDEEYECVTVTGRKTSYDEVLNYVEALEADGWVDILADYYEYYQAAAALFGQDLTIDEVKLFMFEDGGFSFEKEVTDGEHTWWVGADVYMLDEESQYTSDGTLFVDVYDTYLYTSAEANTAVLELIAELDEEAVVELPTINGSHYYVQFDEGDIEDEEEPSVTLAIYDCESTLAQIKDLFAEKGFTANIVDVPANEEMQKEAYSYVEFESADGLICGNILDYDGDIEITFYAAEGEEETGGATFNFSEYTETSGEMNGISFTTAKGGGQTVPAYNENNKQLRLYAKNTMVVASTGDPVTSIDIECTFDNNGTLTASTGTLTSVTGGYHWEGSASEVTFTVSDKGQVRITLMNINGGGTVVGDDAESIIKGIASSIFGSAVEGVDYDAEDDGSFFTGVTLPEATEEDLEDAVEYVISYFSDIVTIDEYGITPYNDSQSGLSGYEAYCYNADESVEVNVYSFMYEGVLYVNISVYDVE